MKNFSKLQRQEEYYHQLEAQILLAEASNQTNIASIQFQATSFDVTENVSTGDTLLHIAVREKNIDDINNIIKNVGAETASKMALTVNNQGHIPLEYLLIEPAKFTDEENKKITALLLPIMLLKKIKKLSELINPEEIIDRYHPKEGSKLYTNLHDACLILNLTRAVIKHSSTHPDTNEIDFATLNPLYQQILQAALVTHINRSILITKMLEQNSDEYDLKITDTHQGTQVDVTFSSAWGKEFLSSQVYVYKQVKMANCYDMSYIALDFLKKYTGNDGCVLGIEKGDHVILAVDPNSDATVICDVWYGNVYPKYDLDKQLATHKSFRCINGQYYNFVTSFNPNCHSLTPGFLSENNITCIFHPSEPVVAKARAHVMKKKAKDAIATWLQFSLNPPPTLKPDNQIIDLVPVDEIKAAAKITK